MIKRFKGKALRELFERGQTKHINARFHGKLIDLLDLLDAATEPRDLLGVSDFHPLGGNRKGQYSMHVNGIWTLTFCFDDGEVTDVEFEDYH